MRLAFEVSYIGTFFYGSQQQTGKRTVMGEIIRCLGELNLFLSESDAKIAMSGRTDRGVHAKRQIIAFDTEYPERAVTAINKKLPADIRVTGWMEVPPGFNPRFEAKNRTYRYYFPSDIPGLSYDTDKMKAAAAVRSEEHT
ncbi:MAG: tRNA pseudouridine(38-40) synthase TruA, partial [Methanomicrobium sp.]|nr:tRNA pseudouridine(38-40) synthase TruA [Methanomicrobium sp.]